MTEDGTERPHRDTGSAQDETATFSPLSSYGSFSGSGSETVTALSPPLSSPLPLAISTLSTSFSSPSRPLPFDSSSSFQSLTGRLVDGPLHDLLPALSIRSASVSSSDESSALGLSIPGGQPSSATGGRRIVSGGFSSYLTSPSRSSPLSRGHGALEQPWQQHSASFLDGGVSPPSTGDFFDSRLTSNRRRRRSSISLSSSTGSAAPPFGSFVGSFENSLLAGRMSALPSHPLPFIASIGVLGGSDTPLRLRCPTHLHLPFSAVFYSPPGEVNASAPYVASIDLEAHFHSLIQSTSDPPTRLPRFPGYELPVRGQLQIVVKSSFQATSRPAFACKPFLVPYDLTGLDRGGKGGRTFLRQKTYAVAGTEEREGGRLRFAVHLQFCSPPTTKKKGKTTTEPKYYLFSTLRVVFAPRALEVNDKLRVVVEGPVVQDDSAGRSRSSSEFSAYIGAGEEWDTARKKAKEREKLRESRAPIPTSPQSPSDSSLTDTHLQHVQYDTLNSNLFPASPSIPLSPPLVPFLASPSPLTLPAAPSSAPLTFDRVPSPRLPHFLDVRDRKLSQSGLAASRPSSRNESSSSRERCGR